MTVMLAMFATLLVCLVVGMPIAVALGGTGLLWLVLNDPAQLRGAAYAVWNSSNNVTLLAIPLFLIMGELVQRTQISVRFYRALSLWVRWLPGGLLHSNIGACAVFSAVSGSSVATAATIATAAIPDLTRLGYRRNLICGTLAAGGTLGILIPPSIPMIIYGAITETSVGRLFLAGIVPGMLVAFFFSAYVAIESLRDPAAASRSDPGRTPSSAERLRSLLDIAPITFVILIVIAALYGGWATPTEVAGLGAAAAAIIAASYGYLRFHILVEATASAVRFSAMLMFVILGANLFSFALFSWGVTRSVIDAIGGLALPALGIFAMIVLMYLILGMFIDAISMMVLTLSVVFPVITHLGYDPVWFGVVLVILLEIGLITPPVGINLYTIRGLLPGSTLQEVSLAALPFVALLLLAIALLVLFPDIALWLPRMMM
jgi:tripartite ATP-independent transporter DctM subunit